MNKSIYFEMRILKTDEIYVKHFEYINKRKKKLID